jgi:hypothetical protein
MYGMRRLAASATDVDITGLAVEIAYVWVVLGPRDNSAALGELRSTAT